MPSFPGRHRCSKVSFISSVPSWISHGFGDLPRVNIFGLDRSRSDRDSYRQARVANDHTIAAAVRPHAARQDRSWL